MPKNGKLSRQESGADLMEVDDAPQCSAPKGRITSGSIVNSSAIPSRVTLKYPQQNTKMVSDEPSSAKVMERTSIKRETDEHSVRKVKKNGRHIKSTLTKQRDQSTTEKRSNANKLSLDDPVSRKKQQQQQQQQPKQVYEQALDTGHSEPKKESAGGFTPLRELETMETSKPVKPTVRAIGKRQSSDGSLQKPEHEKNLAKPPQKNRRESLRNKRGNEITPKDEIIPDGGVDPLPQPSICEESVSLDTNSCGIKRQREQHKAKISSKRSKTANLPTIHTQVTSPRKNVTEQSTKVEQVIPVSAPLLSHIPAKRENLLDKSVKSVKRSRAKNSPIREDPNRSPQELSLSETEEAARAQPPITIIDSQVDKPPSMTVDEARHSIEVKDKKTPATLEQTPAPAAPKKRGRPRLNPERFCDTRKKSSTQELAKKPRYREGSKPTGGQNLANIEAFIGSEPVTNIQKGLLAGPSVENREIAALAIQFLKNVSGAEQTGCVARKVLRVISAIRRKSLDKKPEKMASEVSGDADCIAYVGDVPEALKEKGVNPVSLDEVKSWYPDSARESDLTAAVSVHGGTYRIAVRPEGLGVLLSQRAAKRTGEISIRVPLPYGSTVAPMNEFIDNINQINGLPHPVTQVQNPQDRNSVSYNPHCPGPQHKNWLQDGPSLEKDLKEYVASKMTYYESLYGESQDENAEQHVSPQISRSHVTAMLVMPVERFFKLCTRGERCETYKLGLRNGVEPFVGMSYLSPLELSYAIEQQSSPIEGGLCYLCMLSCYTTQYAHNSAAGSSVRIRVPFQHIHSVPGEYIKESMIAQTTGMTHGLLTILRQFCVNDYVPVTRDVTLSNGVVMKGVKAFEEKGHLVFRYSSRNPQPLCTDPQQSYTVGCAPNITTCFLLRESFRSGVTSKLQMVSIIDLYATIEFIGSDYRHLIAGPSSHNPGGAPALLDIIFPEPPRPTRRRSVTIKTKDGESRRNTHLSSSTVSHVLSNNSRYGSHTGNSSGPSSNRQNARKGAGQQQQQQQQRPFCYGNITASTFGGRPFDVVFSDNVASVIDRVDDLAILFGFKQSGVDGIPIMRYPFISLYDDKSIESKRVAAYKKSKQAHNKMKSANSRSTNSGDVNGDNGDDCDDGDLLLDEGEEMFSIDLYKFFHSILIRINVAWSIGETISRAGKLTFSQVVDILDNIADPHRDTQANKDSKESKELKERIKLYDRLGRKYVLEKLVHFINGHRSALEFFHKYGAVPDEELQVVQDKWVYIPSKVKEWRTVMRRIEPIIPYKPNKLDENFYTPTIHHHSKPAPRIIITDYLSRNGLLDNIEYFLEFESTRSIVNNLPNERIRDLFSRFDNFSYWNPQHLFDQIKSKHWGDLSSCSIYVSLLLRIHCSYDLMKKLQVECDELTTRITGFVNSSNDSPSEDYPSYSLADQHFSLIDPCERLPTCYDDGNRSLHDGDVDGGDFDNVAYFESDFFRVFYMELDKYHPTSDARFDADFRQMQTASYDSQTTTGTKSQQHSLEDAEELLREFSQKEQSSRGEYQVEPWITFAKSLLSKSPQGRHHVYHLRKKLLDIREVVYQIRAFICTHANLASYLHTSGLVCDSEIISDRIDSDGGLTSKYLLNYPGEHRFYGEGSQPDCVPSHMYVNFFAHKGTENVIWFYLIGKLLPRCCQSRKWSSKHEQACETDTSYRAWVCMCLLVSLTAMYRYRRQWLSFNVLLKVLNTCRHLRSDKKFFLSFQTQHPGLVMASLRESMIWQIEQSPALLRVYLEYFQQWRSFGLTVKHKMESNCYILDKEGEIRDLSGMVDQLFSGSRFVFRRVCFDFFSFILAIFKETNATLSDSGSPRSRGSSKRKEYTRKTRTPNKKTLIPKNSNPCGGDDDHYYYDDDDDDDDDHHDDYGDDDDDIGHGIRYKKTLYDFTKNSVGITGVRPPKLSEDSMKLVDMFVEFMNPHDDVDLRDLSMIGISPEGIDNLRFIYGLFLAGEQNRSSATMLRQMSAKDYELSFYFFSAVRAHASIIAIPCDADMRASQLEGVRWKYAIRKGEETPDASTAIVFSRCCSVMKSQPNTTEGPRHYGHTRTVFSEEDGVPVCWAKREKNLRKKPPCKEQLLGKRGAPEGGTILPSGKYGKTTRKQTQISDAKSSARDQKDRYEKLCGETAVTAIPGTFVIQHDPPKEKPCPKSYTICPGRKCGSITQFSLKMWGPNGFTCTICDKSDRESMKIPRCDICQSIKKRSQSWAQVFMFDDPPGTGKLELFLVCPFCSRKCGMDDPHENNRGKPFVHKMTFLECKALVERVVDVDDRSQQFAWEHWKPRRTPKAQKLNNPKKISKRKKRTFASNGPTPKNNATIRFHEADEVNPLHANEDDAENFADYRARNCVGEDNTYGEDPMEEDDCDNCDYNENDVQDECTDSADDAEELASKLLSRKRSTAKIETKTKLSTKKKKKQTKNSGTMTSNKKTYFSTRIGRMPRKKKV